MLDALGPRCLSAIVKRMRIKVVALYLFFTVAVAGAAPTALDDKELAKRLIGTWTTAPAEAGPMRSTSTYKPDGTGTELVRRREQSERAEVLVTTRWSITNGVLWMKSIASSDSHWIPVGVEIKYRIMSISAEKFVFETFDLVERKAERKTKVRKKDA